MSLHDAFLADIIEHPDDDAPRLVYADWLDDNGDPERAEFIRLQCAVARLEDGSLSGAVLARQRDLLQRNEGRWSEPLRRLGVVWWTFSRGFIEGVALNGNDFVRDAAKLLSAAPVRVVSLFKPRRCLSGLAACREVSRLQALRLVGCVPPGIPVRRLLAERPLPSLRTLDLHQLNRARWFVELLAGSTTLPVLAELGLAHCGVDDATLATLVASPLAERLEALDLEGNAITDVGAAWLAAASMPRLRWLVLRGNPMGEPSKTALLGAPGLKALRHIG